MFCRIAVPFGGTAALLHCCTAVLLHCCIAALLHGCMLHCCAAAWLHCCGTARLCRSVPRAPPACKGARRRGGKRGTVSHTAARLDANYRRGHSGCSSFSLSLEIGLTGPTIFVTGNRLHQISGFGGSKRLLRLWCFLWYCIQLTSCFQRCFRFI